MSHFDLPGPRYAVAKAQNGNFCDVSRAVQHATRAKSVKMVKTFSPLEPSPRHGSASLGQLLTTIYTQVMTTSKDEHSVKTLNTETR